MTVRKEFTQFLWESLPQHTYVWLNPSLDWNRDEAVPEILIKANTVQSLLTTLRKFPGVKTCQAAFRFDHTLAVFSFGEWSYSIRFIHKMVSKNLFFLAEEEVFARKVKQTRGIEIPCVEHLLEYSVLKAFLNRRGIREEEYQFFKEFHILVQEDLIEFCNEKYQTAFKDLYALTEYDLEAKKVIIQRLKEMPFNRLAKIFNIHWHNFMGNLRREARMI